MCLLRETIIILTHVAFQEYYHSNETLILEKTITDNKLLR